MPKIVLASVHGSAAGAGLSLALMADLCIAAEDARFTPAYAKLGVSPDGGGTIGLTAAVGPRRALQIFLAEDQFSAAQALQWGLVVKVVPAAELKAATRELAHRLAQNAPAAIAATKTADPACAEQFDRASARRRARRDHRLHAHRRVPRRDREVHSKGQVAFPHGEEAHERKSQFGQIYPVPAGDLKQPTDSGITCLGSHSTTFGK